MGNTYALDVLMSVDDAVQVVDPSDQQKMSCVQERVKVQRINASPTKDLQAKRAAVKGPASDLPAAKAKAKSRRPSPAAQSAWSDRIPVGDLTQAELAILTPPQWPHLTRPPKLMLASTLPPSFVSIGFGTCMAGAAPPPFFV